MATSTPSVAEIRERLDALEAEQASLPEPDDRAEDTERRCALEAEIRALRWVLGRNVSPSADERPAPAEGSALPTPRELALAAEEDAAAGLSDGSRNAVQLYEDGARADRFAVRVALEAEAAEHNKARACALMNDDPGAADAHNAADNALRAFAARLQGEPCPGPVPDESTDANACINCGWPGAKNIDHDDYKWSPEGDLLCPECGHACGASAAVRGAP